MQLFTLWPPRKGVSNHIQGTFPIHNGDGQLIHVLKPPCLTLTKERLSREAGQRLMVRVNFRRDTIDITSPFHTSLKDSQKFFISGTIIPFHRLILCAVVCYWVQAVTILLQQYNSGRIVRVLLPAEPCTTLVATVPSTLHLQ